MNRKNREGFRKCSCCKTEKELTSKNFCSDKNRAFGFSYRCRVCDSSKKDYRKHRYSKLTTSQKTQIRNRSKEHKKNGMGRAVALVCSYRSIDKKRNRKFDLDNKFVYENIINKACFYCGDINQIGCDRIDNSIGHLKTNVVPCCLTCNTARMDNFTYQEMIVLGSTIQTIKKLRLSNISTLAS